VGGNDLHNVCPEKENLSSTRTCCHCKVIEGETAHPSSYSGCRYAKDDMEKWKTQKTPKTTNGTVFRVFYSKFATPVLSFAAFL
jgi:hypothetical protein